MTENDRSEIISKALSGALGTLVGVLITYTTTVSSQREDVARLTERIESLTDKIESGMSDRYRGQDARRDFQLRDDRITHNRQEINALRSCCYKKQNDGQD